MDIDENLIDDIGYLIWRISKDWQRMKNKLLVEFGLTGPQLEVMAAIYYNGEKNIDVTQIMLSNILTVDPMTISMIIRNLEKKELISREESKLDTRARIVKLTALGAETRMQARTKLKKQQDILFSNLDKNGLRKHLQQLLVELDKTIEGNNI